MLTCLNKITQFFHSLPHKLFSIHCLLIALITVLSVFMVSSPAHAAVDTYVRRYLQASEPISLELDGQGQTKPFSAEDLSAGKELRSLSLRRN
jgi:photosystem II cytochrome c550